MVHPHIGDVDGDGDNDVLWPSGSAIFFSENLQPFQPAEALPVPARVSPQAPGDGATVQLPLALEWMHTPGAAGYEVQIATDPGFDNVVWRRAGYTGNSLPVAGLDLDMTFHWRVRGVNLSGPGVWSETSGFATTSAACTASPTSLCLNESRFRVEVEWGDFAGNAGAGNVVPFGSADSGLFWFFDADNWEMLVKVLDGCGINGNFWVFMAATTNVEYTLRVTDTQTGTTMDYLNPLGNSAGAITDTGAFATCSGAATARRESLVDLGAGHTSGVWVASQGGETLPAVTPNSTATGTGGGCSTGPETLCLNKGRFRVEVSWRDFRDDTGAATVVPFGSDDSGLLWFFDPDNWEMLIKILNGCDLTGTYWVFFAATTNVEFTVTVTDTQTGQSRQYQNALGAPADAVTDTGALAVCP